MFGPHQGLHLLCLIFYSQIHVALKMYEIQACQKYSFICIQGLTKRYSYVFEWNVKATLNLLTYQILNLQGESYKTGIQADPTIHTFLFSYILMKMPYCFPL